MHTLAEVAPQLTALNINHVYRVTDAGMAAVARLTRLQALNVTKCKKLTDAAMGEVARLTRLQSLKLSECELITNSGALFVTRSQLGLSV